MVSPAISPQPPPGDTDNGEVYASEIPTDHVREGGSPQTDIPDRDSSTRKPTDRQFTQVESPAYSTLSNMGTSNKTVDQSSRPLLLSLPREMIFEILRAFPPDHRLPHFNIQPMGPTAIAHFRQNTRLAMTALSRTCRALRQPSQRQLFSDIYLTKGKQIGFLLRSLIEEPHFCTYVRRMYLGFALNCEMEAYEGVHTIYEKIDLNKIPRFPLAVLEHCGIEKQRTGALTDFNIEEPFEVFVGLMLSLTTNLEQLTIGFDGRNCTHPSYSLRRGRQSTKSPSGIDRFISAFRSISGGNHAGNPDRTEDSSHNLLAHLRRLEVHGNVDSLDGSLSFFPRISPFPVPSLLALPTLTSFTTYSDSSQWALLNKIDWAVPLAIQELSLYRETGTSLALCSLLERCPDLKKLEIVTDCAHSDYVTFRSKRTRVLTAISVACPNLKTLTLRTNGTHLLFLQDEPKHSWLSTMTRLANLQADVPCLFTSLEDMVSAEVSSRLPPNVENLTIYDMWYHDPRFAFHRQHEIQTPDDYSPTPQEDVNAVAEPFAEMLFRLVSSHRAGNIPKLRKVAVKSPIFPFDTGNASTDLTKAFEAVGVGFKVIPYEFESAHEGFTFSVRKRNTTTDDSGGAANIEF